MRRHTTRISRALLIHPADNVATVIAEGVGAGTPVEVAGQAGGRPIVTRAAIPYGHKVALRPMARGALIIKYGLPIGRATRTIRAGDHVHVHNVESLRGRGDLSARARRRR